MTVFLLWRNYQDASVLAGVYETAAAAERVRDEEQPIPANRYLIEEVKVLP